MTRRVSGWHVLSVWTAVLWAFSCWYSLLAMTPVTDMLIRAVRVQASEPGQVILPADGVHYNGNNAYVWLDRGGWAQQFFVQADKWRGDLWRVQGLPDQAIVLLNGDMQITPHFVSSVINTEAGMSAVQR